MKKIALLLAAVAALLLLSAPAEAQALPNQVLALYPQQTGELVYADLQALRRSSHYAQFKAQVLPDRFRQLEQWVSLLGISFDREIRQLSWAFVPGSGDAVQFVGVAEGDFSLSEIEQRAQKLSLAVERSGGVRMVSLGRNAQGQEFVFAFLDQATALFGFRDSAQEILDRRAQGGVSLLNNAAMNNLVTPLNGQAPIWIALDQRFTALALKQMLPEASQVPGFDQAATRLRSATIRFELRDGLRSVAAIRCQDVSDAMLFSTAAQAAVSYQAMQLRDTNPELSRMLAQVRLNRQDDRLDMEMSMGEPDLVALLQKNGLTLRF